MSKFSDGNGRRTYSHTIGFSEIDKYASAVLKFHWPNIKNYGDIKKINWAEVPDFDLLTGGSPCQDLSVAGGRKGLDGERSGLFYEFIRAITEKKPKYFIWENVKGALSSQKGWDFGTVLDEMAEAGYSLWWQVLNATSFNIPQNRERIFVVGFRNGSPREVFFERNSNSKNFTTRGFYKNDNGRVSSSESRQEKVEHTGNARNKTDGESSLSGDKPYSINQLNNPTHSNNRLYSEEGISLALNTAQGGNRQPKIVKVCGDVDKRKTYLGDIASTLASNPTSDNTARVAIPVLTPDRLEKRQNGRRMKEDGEPSFTLTSQDKHGIFDGMKIRRLTPTECERLMGLPDDWLKYGINEKGEQFEVSDTQRYKMAGNGIVVAVAQKIIEELTLNQHPTPKVLG